MCRTAAVVVTLAALLALCVPSAAADPMPVVIGQFDWTEDDFAGVVFKVFNLSANALPPGHGSSGAIPFEEMSIVIEGTACTDEPPCLLSPLLIVPKGESLWPVTFVEPGSVTLATLSLVFGQRPVLVTLRASDLSGEDIRIVSAPITIAARQVPEPAAMSLLAAGLVAVAGRALARRGQRQRRLRAEAWPPR